MSNFSLNASKFDRQVLGDSTEAVRIANLRYRAGSMDLLSVLQLQNAQLRSHGEVIQLRNAQLVNRIDLHLVLGGSFEAMPAVAQAVVGW